MSVLAHAAVGGVALDIALPLAAIAGLCLGIALQRTWDYHIGAVLSLLADALTVKVWRIRLDLSGPFDAANTYLQRKLGQWINANEQALGLWWHANKQIVSYLGDTLRDYGADVAESIDNLVHGTIPATVRDATRPVADRADRGRRAGEARDRAEAKVRARGIDATQRDLLAEKLARERGIDNVGAKARAYTDARVGRAAGAIRADQRRYNRVVGRRLSRVERWLGVGVIGATAIAALTRVFPYWQCSNVRRMNRLFCRMPVGLLNDLLGLAGAIVLLSDVCRIGRAVELLARGVEGPMLALVTATDAAAQCTSFPAPAELPLRAAALPASEALVSL